MYMMVWIPIVFVMLKVANLRFEFSPLYVGIRLNWGSTTPNGISFVNGFRLEGGWNILVRVLVIDSTHGNS